MPGEQAQFTFEIASRKIPFSRIEFCWCGPVFGSRATTVGVQNYIRVLKFCKPGLSVQVSFNAKTCRVVQPMSNSLQTCWMRRNQKLTVT